MNWKPIAYAAVAVFTPIHTMLWSVLVLVLGDFVTGVWAAVRRGESLTSRRGRDTLAKLFIYEGVLTIGFLAETYLMAGALPVVKLIAALIAAVEMKSLLENCDSILGGSLFKSLIERLTQAPPK